MEIANENLPASWQTRDGSVVLIREMSHQHLLNAAKMVVRVNGARIAANGWAWAVKAYSYASTAPDGASMAAEQAASEYSTPRGMLELWEREDLRFAALMAEIRRRRFDKVFYAEYEHAQ